MCAAPLEAGQTVAGRYRVVKLLGSGGMGAVYEAEHLELGKRVALKVLLPAIATDGEAVARFLREARSAAAIGHPGIVEVFDLDHKGDVVFLAMEKLEGEELADRISHHHPLAIDFIIRVGIDLSDAIAAAHACGIIHRDLKPQNVFLARRGRAADVVKVLDFGIAKLVETSDLAGVPLTQSGQVYGTPLYMAPEQLKSSKLLDGRADVYAMGAILYQAITGRAPFSAESFPMLVVKVLMETPTPIRELRPDAPDALVSLVERAMAKEVKDRVESAAVFRDELLKLGKGSVAPPPSDRARAEVIELSKTLSATPVPSELVATPFSSTTDRPPPPDSVAPPRQRSRALYWVAGGVVVVAGVLGVGASKMWLSPSSDATPSIVSETPEGTPQRRAAAANPPPPAHPEPEPTPTVVPPASPPPASGIVNVLVRFESRPSDAEVSVNGEVVCTTTPCMPTLAEVPSRVTVRLAGYEPGERELAPPFRDLETFTLVRTRRRVPTAPGEEGPSPPPLLNR